MTKTTRLTDLHLVLLAGAAARDSGSLIPLPESCAQDTSRIAQAIKSLLRRGLVEEQPVTQRELAWRQADQATTGLFITEAGRVAIGADAPAAKVADVATPPSPHPTSKIATVLSLMRRQDGATLDELVTATGWLPHTTRAALTGLRKKGHLIDKSKRGDVTAYRIAAEG